MVSIIGCTEIFIERPKNLTVRAQTWSNYKDISIAKYLIGITPSGTVIFLSAGWCGRVSNKLISIDSCFFEKIYVGDLYFGR